MIVTDIRPLLAVAFPLVASLLILFSGKHPNIRESFSIIAAVGAAISALSMSGGVAAGTVYEFVLCPLTDTLSLTLRADYAGELFACVSSFLYVVVAFYAIGYMRGHHEKDQTGFYAFFAICICSAVGWGGAISANFSASTSTKSLGRMTFSWSMASWNKGAISSGVNAAIPQPMRVTRNLRSGCCWAKAMNSST